eukprot:gene15417-21499_t
MAVNALLKGNRANQLSLCRCVVNTWLTLGGLSAMVKLLNHHQPLVVEVSARCIADTLTRAALPSPASSKDASAKGGEPSKGTPAAASTKDASAKGGELSKGTLAAAASTKGASAKRGASANPKEPSAKGVAPSLSTVVNSLIQAKAPAALLEVCRAQQHRKATLEAALVSIKVHHILIQAKAPAALLEVCRAQQRRKATLEAALVSIKVLAGDTAARAALVDAGAMGVLQRMMGTPAPDLARLAAAASQQLHAPA